MVTSHSAAESETDRIAAVHTVPDNAVRPATRWLGLRHIGDLRAAQPTQIAID